MNCGTILANMPVVATRTSVIGWCEIISLLVYVVPPAISKKKQFTHAHTYPVV